jgi:hypothetical protein
MSILKSKHSGWTWDMKRTPFTGGGGGGGQQPSQTTSYNTNVPEYAKPYVTTMLEATQKQLFNTQPGADGVTEITGFKPYTPYSSDPTKYFAGPTGLQTGVYNEAAGMQTPGAYGQAQNMAGMSGLGQLGTTGQAGILGGMGTGLGMSGVSAAAPAFGAGQQFAQQVTDPRSMQAFMSPYQQAVTDVAKNAAIREAQLAQQATNLGAARQGTYGGARQALMQGERERNLLANLSNIQAQGSQAAFDKAMQAQQFGANLGLQGIQTGLQGIQTGMQGIGQGLQGVGAQQAGFSGAGQAAATLGQLGGAQQQSDLARMGFQQQVGKAQQDYQQNIINQAIQDYATAQQYPLMQLGFMSNMLRGLPMQATTTQSYMPTPNLTTQAISGLGTAAGAARAFGFKEGGKVPGYAGPEGSVVSGMRAKLEALADSPGGEAQVARIAQTSPSQEMRALANEVLLDKEQEKRAAAQAEQSIAQDQAMGRGLAAAPAPVMDTMSAAGGGIVAFAGDDEEGSVVEYDPTKAYNDPYKVLSDEQAIARQEARRKAAGIGEVVSPQYREFLTKQTEGMPGYQRRLEGLEMMKTFAKMNRPGSTVNAVLGGLGESTESIAKMYDTIRGREEGIAKGEQELYGRERADRLAILTGTDKEREQALKNIAERNKARITNNQRTTDLMQVFNVELAALGAQKKDINDPAVRKTAMDNAQRVFGGRGPAQETKDLAALTNAIRTDKDIGEKGVLTEQLKRLKIQIPPKDPKKLAEYNKAIDDLENKIANQELILERRFLNRQRTSSEAPINVDNLPPKR